MSDSQSASPVLPTVDDAEIKRQTRLAHRSFIRKVGVGVSGAVALTVGVVAAADSDTTQNKDLKATDSDSHNSKSVDSDQNRLRDYKGK